MLIINENFLAHVFLDYFQAGSEKVLKKSLQLPTPLM
jgi:hypothetical protein